MGWFVNGIYIMLYSYMDSWYRIECPNVTVPKIFIISLLWESLSMLRMLGNTQKMRRSELVARRIENTRHCLSHYVGTASTYRNCSYRSITYMVNGRKVLRGKRMLRKGRKKGRVRERRTGSTPMIGIMKRIAVRGKEREGSVVSRKRLGNGVKRKEGEHWLKSLTKVVVRYDLGVWKRKGRGRWHKSPTKVEVRSERLEKAGETREEVGSNPRRKSRCDPNVWKR